MGFWQCILISAGLSLDVFAFFLYKGAMVSRVNKAEVAKTTALFTGFQVGMMLVGCMITRIPAIKERYRSVSWMWTFLAAITFFTLGTIMIIKSIKRRKRKIEEKKQDTFNYSVILFWAFITSIDALIAGVGFGFMGLQLMGVTIVMAAITAAASIAGFAAGFWLGCGPMNTMITVGGCLVIIGGVDLFIKYLSFVL